MKTFKEYIELIETSFPKKHLPIDYIKGEIVSKVSPSDNEQFRHLTKYPDEITDESGNRWEFVTVMTPKEGEIVTYWNYDDEQTYLLRVTERPVSDPVNVRLIWRPA